jgi:hypothetical protein
MTRIQKHALTESEYAKVVKKKETLAEQLLAASPSFVLLARLVSQSRFIGPGA